MKKHVLLALIVLMSCALRVQNLFEEMLKNGFGKPTSVLGLINIYTGQDSLAYVRTWSTTGTTVLLSSTLTNTVTQQTHVVLPVSAPSSGSDTIGFGGLIANAPYKVVFRLFDGFTLDSVVVYDSTFGGVPSPASLSLSVVSVGQTNATLALNWNQNNGGIIFATYEDSTAGGSWNFVTAKVFSGSNSGIDTLVVSQQPGTTKYYRAHGYNQMFPLGIDTTPYVAVTIIPLLATPPSIGQMSVVQIDSTGGSLILPIEADSVGGVAFIQITSNGSIWTLPNLTFLSFDSTYVVPIGNCDPLSSVLVTVTLYSYNPAWATHTDTISFVTASGPFEISILGCYATGTNSIGIDVEYSSGGVVSNTIYAYAFLPGDTSVAVGYSQMYSVGLGQNTLFTVPITTGLSQGAMYDVRVYQFNSTLGQVQSSGYCSTTTLGTTGVDEHIPLQKKIFYDSSSESISNYYGYTFSVLDVSGRCIYTGNQTTLSMSEFPATLYLIIFNGEKGIKFVK